jgi:hypothetical protein
LSDFSPHDPTTPLVAVEHVDTSDIHTIADNVSEPTYDHHGLVVHILCLETQSADPALSRIDVFSLLAVRPPTPNDHTQSI